jgi:hypothetical protein
MPGSLFSQEFQAVYSGAKDGLTSRGSAHATHVMLQPGEVQIIG